MKINFKKNLTNLSGEKIMDGKNPIGLNVLLANSIVSATEIKGIKPARCLELALDINKSGIVDFTSAERESIKEFIDQNKTFTILTKAQLMNIITKLENEK